MLIMLLGIFGGMTALLGWITYREWGLAMQPRAGAGNSHFPAAINDDLRVDLIASSDVSLRLATNGPWQKIEKARLAGSLAEVERLLDQQLHLLPKDLYLQMMRWELLSAANRFAEAAEHLRSIRSSFQLGSGTNTFFLLEELAARAKCGEHDKVREACNEFLRSDASVTQKTWVLDRLACLPIKDDLRSYLHEADCWSSKALELDPKNLSLKGTRGALLVERSLLDEGEVLLREVFENSASDFDYGICAFYLGLIAKRRGNEVEASRYGRMARRTLSDAWLSSRISEELGID